MWSVEKHIGHWDGYAGVKESANQPNNYYLYSNSQGVLQMLPRGTDETFQSDRHISFDGRGSGVLFGMCLDDEACATAFWHSLNVTVAAAKTLQLAPRAATLDALLAPWQVLEQGNGHDPYPRSVAHGEALSAAEFASSRIGEAESWLLAHQPPAEEEPGGGGTPGDGGGTPGGGNPSGGPSSSGAVPGEPSPPAPRLRHLRPTHGGVRTVLTLAADATVSQRATFATADGRRTACVVPSRHHDAGNVASSATSFQPPASACARDPSRCASPPP